MSCFPSGLSERGIFPVYCTSYFCDKCFFFEGLKNEILSIPRLKNEESFESFSLEIGCLIVQDFKNEAYIPYTVLRIFVLSAFFFLGLEERYLKYSASEERGIFQIIRAWYGLFRSTALKTRHI